jgi:hypothetical protein
MIWDFGKVRTRLTQLLWTTRIFDCAHPVFSTAHRPEGPC